MQPGAILKDAMTAVMRVFAVEFRARQLLLGVMGEYGHADRMAGMDLVMEDEAQ